MKKCVFILSSILMVVITSCGNKNTSDAITENLNSDSIIFDKGIDPNKQIEDIVVTDSIVTIDIIDDDKNIKTTEPLKEVVSNKYITKLKEMIEEGNRSCPMDLGMLGEVQKMNYNENSNHVKFHYLIDETNTPLTIYDDTKNIKQSLKITLFTESSRPLMKSLIDAKAGLQLIYKGSKSQKTKKINLSYTELKEAYNNPITEKEKNLILMENQIARENGACPMTVSEGMVMDKVFDTGSYVVWRYRLDEDYYSLSDFSASEVKQNMIAVFKDPTINQIMQLMIKNNRGVIYRYYGDTSNKTVDVKFTVSELKQNL